MRVCTNNVAPFIIGTTPIEEVNNFTYLSSLISINGGAEQNIINRINKARITFGMLNYIGRSRQHSQLTKLINFNSNVKPVLLYGTETWKITLPLLNKLQVFINRCLQKIVGIFWLNSIRNEDLWNLTNQRQVYKEIKLRKWRWIGHTLRQSGNNIGGRAIEWNLQGLEELVVQNIHGKGQLRRRSKQ
ncbi:uncharacterized protein LOC115874246 [Sitophilus oryzae]|uniref:Uncharacterized protein LOC115874246 n=1 Tax=Sitophilus oryzae TaxID=7048 RepID=A0A6J2X2Q6_SITOR|nr:uncharacterized protein LOC115874246 [Sitophilus oryzae]